MVCLAGLGCFGHSITSLLIEVLAVLVDIHTINYDILVKLSEPKGSFDLDPTIGVGDFLPT